MPRTTTPSLIGRERELAALARFLDGAPEGPAALVIEGEPGIGKSALWERAVVDAEARLWWALTCRPVEAEAKLAFTAIADLLEPVLDEALPGLPSPQRLALEAAVLRAEAPDRRTDPRAVSVAVLNVLRSTSAVAPVVLAIDDLQWLDAASARALAFALRRVATEPIVVVASARRDPRVKGELTKALPTTRVSRLSLAGLPEDALRDLLRERFGHELVPPALKRIARLAGGNPLFAVELGQALLDAGATSRAGEPLPLPDSLLGVIRQRVSGLDAAARTTLVSAAALSQPTTRLLLALGDDKNDETMRSLERAVDANLIEIHRERIVFVHPLYASALYAAASPAHRRRLHRRLAALVPSAEERARHLALATDGPDEEVAAALELAARAADARGAPEDAADLAQRAAALTPADGPEQWSRRTAQAGEFARFSGELTRSRFLLDRAIDAMAPGPERARALHVQGIVVGSTEQVDAGVDLLERARREAEGDAALCALIERTLAVHRLYERKFSAAAAHARAAVELSEIHGEPNGAAQSLALAAQVEFMLGHGIADEAIARARALWAKAPTSGMTTHPAFRTVQIFEVACELERARADLDELDRLGADSGETPPPLVLVVRSAVERHAGAYAEAGRRADEALAIATETGQAPFQALALAARAAVHAYTGNTAAAREAAAEARSVSERAAIVAGLHAARAVVGFLELSLGNAQAAADELEPIAPELERAGIGEPMYYAAVADQIEALIALGQLERAGVLLDQQERRAQHVGRTAALAASARCRGLLIAAHGDFDDALRLLDEAMTLHERLPMPFELPRTLLARGVVERRANRRMSARASLEAAASEFERLGTPVWVQNARREQARISGRRRDEHDLTPSERRIADLVAQGRTNKEVADTLFVTAKTVETTLSRIYRKLDVRSRTELAAKLAARTRTAARSDALKL